MSDKPRVLVLEIGGVEVFRTGEDVPREERKRKIEAAMMKSLENAYAMAGPPPESARESDPTAYDALRRGYEHVTSGKRMEGDTEITTLVQRSGPVERRRAQRRVADIAVVVERRCSAERRRASR